MNFVLKMMDLCIQNAELCIQNAEFCAQLAAQPFLRTELQYVTGGMLLTVCNGGYLDPSQWRVFRSIIMVGTDGFHNRNDGISTKSDEMLDLMAEVSAIEVCSSHHFCCLK